LPRSHRGGGNRAVAGCFAVAVDNLLFMRVIDLVLRFCGVMAEASATVVKSPLPPSSERCLNPFLRPFYQHLVCRTRPTASRLKFSLSLSIYRTFTLYFLLFTTFKWLHDNLERTLIFQTTLFTSAAELFLLLLS